MNTRSKLVTLVGLGLSAGLACADVLRVDDDAAPGGDGSSWSRAFDSLTDALAAASSGDEVWVAEGAYLPELPASRDATFLIPPGVRVYGGFEGGESSLAQRPSNPLNNQTDLKGTGPTGDPVYSVVTFDNAGSNTILDGFVISGARADGGSNAQSNGGGIYAQSSSPDLRFLYVFDCEADIGGGAIFLDGTTSDFTRITDSLFEGNSADFVGGAIDADVPVTIGRCEFVGNHAESGGGLHLSGEGVHTVIDSEFRSNSSSGRGGAISNSMGSGPSFSFIERCEFRDNSCANAGGVGYLAAGDHTIRDCRFLSNEASSGAGAISFRTASAADRLLVENCLITGNSGVGGPGGIRNSQSGQLWIVNTTVAGNFGTAQFGGGVAAGAGDVVIDNSILWDNSFGSLFNNFIGTLTVNRSIVGQLSTVFPPPGGVGAIEVDPLFVDLDGPDNVRGTPDDNVRLMPNSPAIDAGDNTVVSPFVGADIYSDPRFVDDSGVADTGVPDGANPIIDMGCAEFQGSSNPGCNAADLAEPYGALDFGDVLAFLTAFGSMGAEADLALPAGVFDFADVLAFLSAFGAGCP